MDACAFFGNKYDKDIRPETSEALERIFKYLIIKKDIKIFYTTSYTPFDLLCEKTVIKLRKEFEDIKFIVLIKIGGKNDKPNVTKGLCDAVIPTETNRYKDRCLYASHLADYLVFQTTDSVAPEDNLFLDIALASAFKKENHECIDVKKYIEELY